MYVSKISLENVRSFRRLDLNLAQGGIDGLPRFRTILIGENGTGKTTLLRAIAVGLANPQDTGGLLSEANGQLVSEGESKARISLDVSEQDGGSTSRLETWIDNVSGQDILKAKEPVQSSTDFLVCAYGIGRSTEGPETGRDYRILDSVYTLFQYEQTLIQTELTLRRLLDFLGDRTYDSLLNNIKAVLGLAEEDSIELPRGGGVRISGERIGKSIPLEGWADGYRKTLAWILDLYAWAMRAKSVTEDGDIHGILLVDELEQHLHPSLQTQVLNRLGTLLPHMQIIASTHSPLVVLGASPDELVVLKRMGTEVSAHESVRDFYAYSVEDVLRDPALFDAEVYNPELSGKLERYRMLASVPQARRSPHEEETLEALAADLTRHEVSNLRSAPAHAELERILKKHNL